MYYSLKLYNTMDYGIQASIHVFCAMYIFSIVMIIYYLQYQFKLSWNIFKIIIWSKIELMKGLRVSVVELWAKMQITEYVAQFICVNVYSDYCNIIIIGPQSIYHIYSMNLHALIYNIFQFIKCHHLGIFINIL